MYVRVEETESDAAQQFPRGLLPGGSGPPKYEKEPWFPLLHGDVSFLILQRPAAELKKLGPKLFSGAPAQYDPMSVLRNSRTPQLWILGKDDTDAPSAETAPPAESFGGVGFPDNRRDVLWRCPIIGLSCKILNDTNVGANFNEAHSALLWVAFAF